MTERWGLEVAVEVSGASQGNIRDWAKRGHLGSQLEPSGKGKVRGYTKENIREFTLLKTCSTAGVPHKWVKLMFADQISRAFHEMQPIFVYEPQTEAQTMFPREWVRYDRLFGRPRTALILIDVERVLAQVDAELNERTPMD